MSRHQSCRRGASKNGARGGRIRRAAGAGSALAAFLAFGMTPLTTGPVAHADGFDDLLDPGFWGAFADVPGGADGGSLIDIFEQFDLAVSSFYHDNFYLPLYDLGQDFITQNAQLLDLINSPFVELFGRDLIGNGLDGFTGTNDSLFGSSGLFGDAGDGGAAGVITRRLDRT